MKNRYKVVDDYIIIYLERRNNTALECYVDLDSFKKKLLPTGYRWYARYSETAGTFYAEAHSLKNWKKHIQMHRLLFDLLDKDWIEACPDHLDHNGLNNRRSNIEIKTKTENHFNVRRINPRNTSGHKGVTWDKSRGKWCAQIQINGKCIMKRFDKKSDAILEANKMRDDIANKIVTDKEILKYV